MMSDDEHQDDAPLMPRRARENGLRRVERPASACGSAGREKARHQNRHGEHVHPVAQHVHKGEHHVPGAHHERDQIVTEPAEKQRSEEIDHHDHAVHGHELIIGLRVDEGESAGPCQLKPDEPRQHQSNKSNRQRSDRVLDGDGLGVLREDVFRYPAMRMVKVYIWDFGRRDKIYPATWNINHP